MKRKFAVLAFILFFTEYSAFSQENKGIEYFVPEIVKDTIVGFMQKTGNNKYYGIWQTQNDTTFILISWFDSLDTNLYPLIKQSNRFIHISATRTIPIVPQSDLGFCIWFHHLDDKGTDHESMEDTDFMIPGYEIEFVKPYDKTEIIKAKYFRS